LKQYQDGASLKQDPTHRVIRYASKGTPITDNIRCAARYNYASDTATTCSTYKLVRQVFRLTSFPPLLSSCPFRRLFGLTLNISVIDDYFPGVGLVERVGGTWYCGDIDNFALAGGKV
jgi:hypothetical protein